MPKSFTAAELNRVMPRLGDILTATEEQKGSLPAWLSSNFPDEVRVLANAFDAVTAKLHARWATALLATLPESSWEDGPCGLMRLKSSGIGASMRFLSAMPSGDDHQEAIRQCAALKELHGRLLAGMPVAKRKYYGEMLTFQEAPAGPQPLAGDTLFGALLHELEVAFGEMAQMQEDRWREETDFSETETVPFQQRFEFGHVAMVQLCRHVESCCRDTTGLENTQESMLAVVSANVSVNRVLLEMAAQDARGFEAEQMCLDFLEVVNQKGLVEVPTEIDSASDQTVDEVIRQLFRRWFAHDGQYIEAGTMLARHMTSTDIDATVAWAREVQATYITHQNLAHGDERAGQQHNNNCSLFAFSLALAAAFFSTATTEHVFKPSSRRNASHALFPGRDAVTRDAGLTVHAKTAVMKAYGLMYFGNRGWDLRVANIKEYSLSAQVRRAQLQLVLNAAVKWRGSVALLALTRHLKEMCISRLRDLKAKGLLPGYVPGG